MQFTPIVTPVTSQVYIAVARMNFQSDSVRVVIRFGSGSDAVRFGYGFGSFSGSVRFVLWFGSDGSVRFGSEFGMVRLVRCTTLTCIDDDSG